MGGPQIWMETADMLGDDTLKRMLADLGAFYFLDSEEKARLTEGRIWKRAFSWPMFATGIAAYSAMRYRNEKLAHQTWNILTGALWDADGLEMLRTQQYCVKSDGTPQMEMPGISTNFTSQWCLNTIMCLEFIREYLPKTLNELNGCPFQRTGRNKNEERLSAD